MMHSRHRLIAASLVCCLFGTVPALARKNAVSPGVRITGRVLLGNGGQPVPGAIVTAIHLDSGKVLTAPPAAADGHYVLPGLSYGYYSFAIEADGVLYAAAGPTNLAPAEKESFDFRLRLPAEIAGSNAALPQTGIALPGLDRTAAGTAEILGLPSEIPFARTPAGIATIVGSVLLGLLLLH